MKTMIKIVKSILIYSIFYLLVNLLFCLIYYSIEFKNSITFGNALIFLLSGTLMKETENARLLMISNAQKFIEMIFSTILTGYIFTYILNREPKIILPDKLTIRHRTSENVNHLLTLGVLVGNKSRCKIYEVRCVVYCVYLKDNNQPNRTNGEFQLFEEIHAIDNFYRFSFELEKFPRKILDDFLSKNHDSLKIDTISISISGHSKMLGNSFLVSKKYKLTDLVIDEHLPQLTKIHNVKIPFSKKQTWTSVRWDEFNRVEYVSENDREKTIDEIRNIIKNKV